MTTLTQQYKRDSIWILDEEAYSEFKKIAIALDFKTPSHLFFRLIAELNENRDLYKKLSAENTLRFYLKMAQFSFQTQQRKEQEQRKLNELLLVDANRYNEKIDEKREIEAEVNEDERQEAEQIEKIVAKARKEGKTKEWLDGLKKKSLDWRSFVEKEEIVA